MAHNKSTPIEENLDPTNWESMRALGHRMVDDMVEYLKSVRERPAWRHAPSSIQEHFSDSIPLDPQSPEDVYQEFCDYVLPWPVGNIHPRFWGWIFGTGTIMGAVAEMLAGTMNIGAACGLSYNRANYVEVQVLNWLKEIIGFPASASGLLTTGCSDANLIGLAVARNTKAGYDLRRKGIQAATRKMVLYASEEIHSSVEKAIETMEKAKEVFAENAVELEYCRDPYEVAKNSHALIIATEWDDFSNLNLRSLKSNLKKPVIFDGRNLLDPEKVSKAGMQYHAIGGHERSVKNG